MKPIPTPSILLGEPERIAIFRALFVGDLLMTVPAFRALRHRFPKAEITLIGLPWARSIMPHLGHYLDRFVEFQGYPGLPEVEVVPERTAGWLREQQEYGYDLALQMHGDGNISNELVAALGARVTAGFALPGDDRLTLSLPAIEQGNEVLRWLTLTAMLGAPAQGAEIDFPLTTGGERQAERLLSELPIGSGPLVGLHIGAKAANRRWPPECFTALGDELVERYGARIVLTGSESERGLTQTVAERMRCPVLDLAGRTDIGAFAAVIARLDLLVSNDTGASHLAAATRTRSIVLFGAEVPERYAPLNKELHRIVDAVALAGPGADPDTALLALPLHPVLTLCEEAMRMIGVQAATERSKSTVRA